MKRVIAISFLLLVFFGHTGSRFIYFIIQHEAKEAAEKKLLAGIPESYLEVIDFANNKNEIEWEEFALSENMNTTERKVPNKYTDHDVTLVSSIKNITTSPPKFLYNA